MNLVHTTTDWRYASMLTNGHTLMPSSEGPTVSPKRRGRPKGSVNKKSSIENSTSDTKQSYTESKYLDKFLNSPIIQEFLSLPTQVQAGIDAILKYEKTLSEEFFPWEDEATDEKN